MFLDHQIQQPETQIDVIFGPQVNGMTGKQFSLKSLQMVLKLVFRKFHTRLEKFSKFSKFSPNTLFLHISWIEFILE